MTAPTVIPERLERVQGIELRAGAGKEPNGDFEACVMQAVAYVAGETWSDHPKCASPVLTDLLIRLNDRMNDADRQLLKPFIPRLVGTNNGKATDDLRRQMLLDWAIRIWTPRWLRQAGLDEHAAKLERLKIGPKLTQKQRDLIYAARDAAWVKRRERYAEIRSKHVAVAVAVAAADAVAAAVAVAVADAAAVAAAVAVAAADAAAVAVAAAAKKKGGTYSQQYDAAYKAAKPILDEKWREVFAESRDEVLALLDRLIEVRAKDKAA